MNKCKFCGDLIKGEDWKDTCFSCWKRQQTGNGKYKIREVIKRLKQKEVVD